MLDDQQRKLVRQACVRVVQRQQLGMIETVRVPRRSDGVNAGLMVSIDGAMV